MRDQEAVLKAKKESNRKLYDLRKDFNRLKVVGEKVRQEIEVAKLQTKEVL